MLISFYYSQHLLQRLSADILEIFPRDVALDWTHLESLSTISLEYPAESGDGSDRVRMGVRDKVRVGVRVRV